MAGRRRRRTITYVIREDLLEFSIPQRRILSVCRALNTRRRPTSRFLGKLPV